jgi:membrane associated rhomboid family serine protease
MTISFRSFKSAPPSIAPWRDGHTPKAPERGANDHGSRYGYFYRDRRSTTFAFLNQGEDKRPRDGFTSVGVETLEALRDRLTAPEGPKFVWTPRQPKGVATELCPELTKTLAHQKLKQSQKSARLSAFVCLFFLIIWLIPGGSPSFLIFFLLFGLIPLGSELLKLQAFRRHPLRQVRRDRELWLFQQWLGQGKPPATYALCAGLGVLATIHFFYTGLSPGVKAAGLDSGAIAEGEVWRLLSGPLIHGNFLHVSFNILALWAFGRILERFCGGRTLLVVFTLSMLIGAIASWGSLDGRTSVGASGGVLGLLAFLAVFAGRRHHLFPGGFSNALGYNLLLIALLGLILVEIIDNAAHLGGVVCGTLLALDYCRNSETKQVTNFVPKLFLWIAPHAAGLLACSFVWTGWILIR